MTQSTILVGKSVVTQGTILVGKSVVTEGTILVGNSVVTEKHHQELYMNCGLCIKRHPGTNISSNNENK